MDIDNLCTFRVYSNDGRTFLYAGEEGGNYIGTTMMELVEEGIKEGKEMVYLHTSPKDAGVSMGVIITPSKFVQAIDDWTRFRLTGVLEETHPLLSTFAAKWTRREFAEKHHYVHLSEFQDYGFTIPSVRDMKDMNGSAIRGRTGVSDRYLYQAKESSRIYFVYDLEVGNVSYTSSRYPDLFKGILADDVSGMFTVKTTAYLSASIMDSTGLYEERHLQEVKIPPINGNTNTLLPDLRTIMKLLMVNTVPDVGEW